MPIVGTVSASVILAATGTGTASSTIAKQPAASSASASASNFRAFDAVRPCVLKPPRIVSDCGVRPTCPMTPIPAKTMACTRESDGPAPSSLTTSASASFTKRDRKSTRLNSSHVKISYAVFCLKKKKQKDKIVNEQKKTKKMIY